MNPSRLLPLCCAVACSSPEPSGTDLPYHTTFSTSGDTVIAATTGEVPDRLLRHVVVEWRTAGDSAIQPLGDVGSIAVAPDGQVWVWDPATPALWLLDAEGKTMRRVGGRGAGPGEYLRANDIAVAQDGSLVLWDEGLRRLTTYNSDGRYRGTSPVLFSDCCGLPMVIDTAGRLWLEGHPRMLAGKEKGFDPAEFGKPQEEGYFRYAPAGTPLDTLVAPMLPGAYGMLTALHISATGAGGAAMQVPYGTYPWHAASPLGHIVSALARPYVVYSMNGGKPLRLTRDYTPVPIVNDERSQLRANAEARLRRTKADFTWNGPDIPSEKPPIHDLAVGLDGRIWVQLSVPSVVYDPGPEPADAGRNEGGPPLPPVRYRSGEKRWDVFEPDGRYLGRIAVPREISLFVMRGNLAWGVLRDEDDVPTLVRLRIDPGLQD